jgi:hypothetical protein
MTRREVGDGWRWAAPGTHASEAGAGLARLGRLQSEARVGRLSWAMKKMEKGEEKEEAGWAELRF